MEAFGMTAPDPFVPPDIDLTSLPGFILDVEHLLASELVATGTPAECWAALMLWCRAWKQVPAGSLPNDDRVLASFSGAGRRWPKIRNVALRGFELCSDGRLYHRFLCSEVLRARKSQLTFENRRDKDRERLSRWRELRGPSSAENKEIDPDETPDETRFETRRVALEREPKEKVSKFKTSKGALGYAPRAQECTLAREAPPETHSAEDKAAVDAIVASLLDTVNLSPSGLRNGVYNEAAYARAITIHKRDTWLNNLATFVGEHIDGMPAKLAAWQAIEQTRDAGSRDATPPDVRRAVDELSRLRETSTAYAEAAE